MITSRIAVLSLIALGFLSAIEHPFRWSEWKPLPYTLSYYNVVPREDGRISLWFDAVLGKSGMNGVVGVSGPRLDKLTGAAPAFTADVVTDYDLPKEGRKHPIISRTSATRLKDGRYVVLTQIGPDYQGGGSELYPALFVSPDGSPGSFTHIGPPAGEPKAWLDERRATNKRIRCEGGAIVQLADGTLRMYVQGYGSRMTIAEAADVAGPWTFRKGADGTPVDLVAGKPGGGWLFPYVMQVGEHGYVLTGADAWPPKAIFAGYSRDGLEFTVPDEPLIRPADVREGASSMKALRGAWDAKKQRIEAVANPWGRQRRTYVLHFSESPFDPAFFAELPQ